MKHGHMGDAFFDIDAAGFLSQQLQTRRKKDEAAKKRAHGEQQCDKHITIKSSDAHESSKSASVHVWQVQTLIGSVQSKTDFLFVCMMYNKHLSGSYNPLLRSSRDMIQLAAVSPTVDLSPALLNDSHIVYV